MAFKIAPFAGQTYPGAYADHHDIRAYLGFGKVVERSFGRGQPTYLTVESGRLPIDFSGSVTVPLTDGRSATLICLPGNPSTDGRRGKSSAHRCYVACPDCGAPVPAGRTHQHKCK
jgi:hypothetical protein